MNGIGKAHATAKDPDLLAVSPDEQEMMLVAGMVRPTMSLTSQRQTETDPLGLVCGAPFP
jgi:hypothetical protein